MGKILPFRKDQTPRSFEPEDWHEALCAGGYWYFGETTKRWYWCPVRDTDEGEALIARTMKQHGLTRKEAVEMLQEAGM